MKTKSILAGIVATVLLSVPALADVRLARVFTDNMMLQRNQPVRVWGWAEPDEAVTVSLAGKQASVKADAKGAWAAELPAMKEGENLELTVTGKNAIMLKNVILGDVWLCGGQSNMEMALLDWGGCLGAAEDIKAADYPRIRRIKINHVVSVSPEPDAPTAGPWQVCTPQTAGKFTAAGFYFAREIVEKTGVPIGLLDDNWGGTMIEPWTSTAALESAPELRAAAAARTNALASYTLKARKSLDDFERWIPAARTAVDGGSSTPPMPVMPVHPGLSGWSCMYNAMISPLVRFPIKGALWYQGESNGNEGESYSHKMGALVNGWRKAWNEVPPVGAGASVGEFPFYFVQLASYQGTNSNPAGGDGWAKLREAQTKSLAITNTGMAVILDTVPLNQAGDIHPKNKYDVGTRLAFWALNRDYRMKNVVPSGPLFKSMTVEGDKVRLTFDYTGSGLMVGVKEGRAPAAEDKAGKLRGFAIAGADPSAATNAPAGARKWFWADAVIDGQTVVVSSPAVKAPLAVRYAFSMNPTGANIYNREGLPASPFRTDAW
jgi:sialate O-acetylesterase